MEYSNQNIAERNTVFKQHDKMRLFLRDFIVSNEHVDENAWWVDEARRILKDNNERIDYKLEAMNSSQDNPANYGPTSTAENV